MAALVCFWPEQSEDQEVTHPLGHNNQTGLNGSCRIMAGQHPRQSFSVVILLGWEFQLFAYAAISIMHCGHWQDLHGVHHCEE